MPIGPNDCEIVDMDEAQRDHLRQTFLQAEGWGEAAQAPLPGDASNRRYIRLTLDGAQAMLMDAPPPTEDIRPFTTIARHLAAHGFSAPKILAEDETNGFLVLEDFGDDTFTNVLAKGEAESSLYELATDTLASLHAKPVPDHVAPYDDERLLMETALLVDWFLAVQDIDITSEARTAYDEAWVELFKRVHEGPKTLVLRDYHVDNLMRLNDRPGTQACGLLDFQDALAGHPAYDLMSLLEDARRDVDQQLQTRMKDRYHAQVGTEDRASFDVAYAILAAQRHAKVIGIFTRLHRRDGKAQYLKHMDRLWRLLEQSLDHQDLATLKAWFDRYVPKDKRTVAKDTP